MKKVDKMIAPAQLAEQLKESKNFRDAMEVLERCYEIHASLVLQLVGAHSVRLACHEGCDLCCSYRVTAKAHEVLLIAENVQNHWNIRQKSRLIERLKEHASRVKELTIEQHLTTADSGPCRPAFRSDADRDSGGMPTGIPLASRPPFRCMPTGVKM